MASASLPSTQSRRELPAAPAPATPFDFANAPAVQSALAAKFDRTLAGTPMAGTGAQFVRSAAAHNVDPYFLLAIAGVESGYGTAGFATNGSHNPFGLGVTGAAGAGARFPSWGAAIEAAAANLGGSLYAGAGLTTIAQVGHRWAADPGWADKVAARYSSLADGARIRTDRHVLGGLQNIPQSDPSTSPIDALGNLAGATGLSSLVGLLGRVFSLGTWLRVLGALGGAALLIVALVVMFKSWR